MKDPDHLSRWRREPLLPASPNSAGKGWSVQFAMTTAGQIPALDFLEGKSADVDARQAIKAKEIQRLDSLIAQIQVHGATIHSQLPPKAFLLFGHGARKEEGLAEFRFGAQQGIRLVCFRMNGQILLITSGFRKPNQRETPEDELERARAIRSEHLARQAQQKTIVHKKTTHSK